MFIINGGRVFAEIDINNKTQCPNEPGYRLTLFASLIKADKLEFVIQKAVELGVFRIVPVITERSIAKESDAKTKRWHAIAEAAAMQSHRGIIPEVAETVRLREAVAVSNGLDRAAAAHEKIVPGTVSVAEWIGGKWRSSGIFIGPEGGFSDKEISFFTESGIKIITMGRRVLRAETAAIAAAALASLIRDT